MMQNHVKVQQSVEIIQNSVHEKLHEPLMPDIGLVAGTGLSSLRNDLEVQLQLPYSALPGFAAPTVDSHHGDLLYGRLGKNPVWMLAGRQHLYEGYEPWQICMGVRTLAGLGVKTLLITNAAGSLNPQWLPGTVMCIADHINMTGSSSLTGPNHDAWGPRFPDMSCVYSPRLRSLAMEEAMRLSVRLEQGVYAGVHGPQMETPAETRMLRMLGADAVGMSTILEVIAARHMGVQVLGLSCLTNQNLPDCMGPASLEDVIAVADAASKDISRLAEAVIARLGEDG